MFPIAVHYGTAGSVVAESPEVEAQIQGPDCAVIHGFSVRGLGTRNPPCWLFNGQL